MCVSGVNDGEQTYELTWDKISYMLDSLFCTRFGLAVAISHRDGVLGQKGGFPHLGAACSKPWAARLTCVPRHRVTSG